MGWFDNEDDEQQPKPAGMDPKVREYLLAKQKPDVVGPSVADAATPVQQREYDKAPLADKYAALAGDTSAVDKARETADSKNMWLGITQGIGQMFAGNKVNGAFFDKMRADNDAKVDDAKAAHKNKLADLLTQDKLGYQDVERQRAATKDEREAKQFGWEEGNKDPSKLTPGAKYIMSKRLGVNPQHLDGLSFDQAKQLNAAAEKAKRDGFQLKAVETENGIEWHTFDPQSGRMAPTGQFVGYKLGIDNVTGTRTSGADKSALATDIMNEGGTSQRDLRTATDADRAYARGTATQQVKDEQAVQVADAKVDKTKDMVGRWQELYDQASKEGPIGNTGVVGGRVAETATGLGFDMGPATNTAANEMERQAQEYIVDKTGLSSTDQQFQRLMKTAPRLGVSPEQFKARSAAFLQEVEKAAAARRAEAGMSAKGSQTAAPSNKTLTPEQEATVKAYEEKYKGKRTRDQIIKALGY